VQVATTRYSHNGHGVILARVSKEYYTDNFLKLISASLEFNDVCLYCIENGERITHGRISPSEMPELADILQLDWEQTKLS